MSGDLVLPGERVADIAGRLRSATHADEHLQAYACELADRLDKGELFVEAIELIVALLSADMERGQSGTSKPLPERLVGLPRVVVVNLELRAPRLLDAAGAPEMAEHLRQAQARDVNNVDR